MPPSSSTRIRQDHRPGRTGRCEATLDKVKALPLEKKVSDPFAEGGTISPDGKLASADVRYEIRATSKAENGRR